MTAQTLRRRSRRHGSNLRRLDARFGRYALAAAAAAAPATATRADFSSPYSLTPPAPGSYTGATASGTFGDWTSSAPFGQFNSASPTLNTSSTPASATLSRATSFGFGTLFFDLTTTVEAAGTISFSYSATLTEGNFGGGDTFVGYVLNGVETQLTSQAGGTTVGFASTASVPVAAGDVFGFRLGVNYVGSGSFTISNFSAPVPEPSVCALAGAGVVGLLGLRAARRRRATAK